MAKFEKRGAPQIAAAFGLAVVVFVCRDTDEFPIIPIGLISIPTYFTILLFFAD